MAFWNAIIGPVATLFTKALDIVDDMVPDKDLAAKLKSALQERILQITHNEFTTLIQSQTQIITAEAQGKSWLQRNWRPLLMAEFGVIILNNYILNPWLNAMFQINIILEIPPDMWNLLKLGLSGYVIGRSAEKIAAGDGVKGMINKLKDGS